MHCSALRCYQVKIAIEQAIYRRLDQLFNIPYAFHSCYFLTDPWIPVKTQGSRPHPKPGAIWVSNDHFSLFSNSRQANLNEAAEKYYGQAASLRPNVSKTMPNYSCPLRFTLMDTLQSQFGWFSSIITGWSAVSWQPSLSLELRIMRARFLLSSEVYSCNIHQQLQRRGRGKQTGKNNDNNTHSGHCDILEMNRVQSLRALTTWVKLFKWGPQRGGECV